MDYKICTNPECRAPYYNEWDLCSYCAERKRIELERRLRQDDGAASLAVVASWVVHGMTEKTAYAWVAR